MQIINSIETLHKQANVPSRAAAREQVLRRRLPVIRL